MVIQIRIDRLPVQGDRASDFVVHEHSLLTNHFQTSTYLGDGTSPIYDAVIPIVDLEATFRDVLQLQGEGVVDGRFEDGEIAHAHRGPSDFTIVYSNGNAGGSSDDPDSMGLSGQWAEVICNVTQEAVCNAWSGQPFEPAEPQVPRGPRDLSELVPSRRSR